LEASDAPVKKNDILFWKYVKPAKQGGDRGRPFAEVEHPLSGAIGQISTIPYKTGFSA
jgi:hypothetical protein